MLRRLCSLLSLAMPLVQLHPQGKRSVGPPPIAFSEVVPGVYATVEPRERALSPLVHGNSMFVVGDSTVFAVDGNRTPSAARSTIEQLKKVTNKPLRTLMLTHVHGDHLLGIQGFVEAYPGIELVSTDSTREDMIRLIVEPFATRPPDFLARAADRYDSLYTAGVDMSGRPLTPQRRKMFEMVRASFRNYYVVEAPGIKLFTPTKTFEGTLTMWSGSREIHLISFPRAHTRSDAIAWLPRERVVAAGDLLVHPVPYMGGAFPSGWLRALRRIAALAPLHIVPGHGEVQHDTRYLDQVIEVVDATIADVRKAIAGGRTVEQAQAEITMERFRLAFTKGEPEVEDRWADFIGALVQGAYTELTPAR